MLRYSKYGMLISVLLVLSIFTIFSISEVEAAENIVVDGKSVNNTIIIEIQNGVENTSNVKTVKIWLSPDNSFKSFKSEPNWGGGQYSDGQLLVFTASTILKPGESVKFGVITEKKTLGINWRVLDENDVSLDSGQISPHDISTESAMIDEDTKMLDEIKETGETLYGTKKFIPEKIRVGSNVRLAGNGFDSSQTLTFYLDNILIKSSKTDDGGNFVTTLSIPDTINPGTSEFIIKNEFGDLQTTNVSISEEKNRLLREASNFELTSIPTEIRLDETLSFSGNAKPLTTIILTIKNEEGQTEKTRVVNVNANGKWEYEELITSKEILGTKTFMLKNGQNHLLRDVLFKSDKLLNISSSATRYNQGDTIIFAGNAVPNTDATIIVEDPNGKIIHFDLIEIDGSGNIEYEFVTDNTFGNGTYVLIIAQETESDAYLFGIGQYPTTQIVVLTDKTNYIGTGSSNAFINVVGPPSTSLSLTVIDPQDNPEHFDTFTTNSAGEYRYELDITGYATGVYTAVVSKANIQDSVKFAVGVQTGSGDITLTPPKQSYVAGDHLIISGQTEQDNSILTVSLINPSGNTVSKIEIFSDSSGSFSTNMLGIPITAEIGNWKLSVISKLDTAENIINVVESSGIQLALNIEKTQYEIGETITIKGSAPITKTTVYIDILDVGGTSIASLETPITNSGLFSLPWTIPSNINFGAYTIEITDAANTDSIEIYIQ
jgi:hypothetical protein